MSRVPAALAAVLLAAVIPGCSSSDHGGQAAGVQADLITPGAWDVRGATDHILAWAHNGGSANATVSWSLTLQGGAPLPEGWNVTFAKPQQALSANGTKAGGARPTYPDWAWTLATLRLPASQGAQTVAAELRTGASVTPIQITVAAQRGAVSGPGSRVDVQYEGRFADDNSRFDSGSFPTTLGSGQTVPGFDQGLMGLAVGENQVLHIPPALAYGYDNPPGRYAQFNGRTLLFNVTIQSIA